ncbi:fumarylacetoacetate hydrolase family protein [Alteribacillus sp. JSM 102045]|uniref:fumarylacetoacetate hydrolase family protein n=1 Tax=Alteribacillus sp. JSM 102045 TaxID=1562101 RepID=UPI0035BF2DA5
MIVRFSKDDVIKYGIPKNNDIRVCEGDPYGTFRMTERVYAEEDVSLLAPVQPSKVVCIGLNYKDHAKEVNLELPKEPLLFLKPSTTVVGPHDEVVYPLQAERLDFEGELAIVMKKEAFHVNQQEAHNYILGYTCANDITARDLQFNDGQWARGKSFDTFCPIGPGIVTDVDPSSLPIQLTVNEEVKQNSNTNELIFSIPYIIEYVSSVMTLLPGDVIITGTPAGVGPMKEGDEVSVSIDGIGTLTNKIVKKYSQKNVNV